MVDLRLTRLIAQLLYQPQTMMGSVHRSRDHLHRRRSDVPPKENSRNIFKGSRDPMVPWNEAPGTQSWLHDVIDEDLPDVLRTDYLKPGMTMPPTTAAQRQRLFCGYGPPQRPRDRPILDVHKHQPDEQSNGAALDVDSYVGFATSLAVAKNGLKVIVVQRPTPSLKAGLHLGRFKVWIHDELGDLVQETFRSIHEIPQISVGRFVDNDDLELTILCPHAVRTNQQIAKLTEEQFTLWMDEVFLPAIHDSVNSFQSRSIPNTYENAVYRSRLRFRNRLRGNNTRTQLLAYHIQGQDLERLWDNIGYHRARLTEPWFRDLMLVVNAKGIKLSTSSSSVRELRTKLKQRLTSKIDPHFISLAYFDLGKEYGDPESNLQEEAVGRTSLWQLSYLDAVLAKFRDLTPPGHKNPIREQQYPQYFIHGVGSVTMEPQEGAYLRNNGLIYAQWYNTVKDLFAAGDNYLAENPAIGDLGLDPHKLAVMQHTAQAISTKQETLIQAYLHIKRFVHSIRRRGHGKAYSMREEYRVRSDLFETIMETLLRLEEQKEGNPHASRAWDNLGILGRFDSGGSIDSNWLLADTSVSYSPNHDLYQPPAQSYLCWWTPAFLQWTRWQINRFCFGIEFLLSDVPRGTMISWSQTQTISMFFHAIACFLGQGTPGYAVRFWYDVFPPRAQDDVYAEQRLGMGMLTTMYRTGFPWFLDRLHWPSLTFRPELATRLGFARLDIERRLHRHQREIMGIRDFGQRIESCSSWLIRFGVVPTCRQLLYHLFFQLCVHQLRCDTLQHVRDSIKKKWLEHVDRGEIPLSYDALTAVMTRGRGGIKIKANPKDQISDFAGLFRYLYADKVPRHARNLPYLLLYRTACQVIKDAWGAAESETWMTTYGRYLMATSWCLPYPGNNRFMNRDPQSKPHPDGKPWLFFNVSNAVIKRQVQRQPRRVPLPLPVDWDESYTGHWTSHVRGK